jgi:hypothetical protein
MLFVFPAGLAIKDFRFGVDGDAKRDRWRMETHLLVKARSEFPSPPVHKHYGGAFIDTDNSAQLAVNADNVICAESEWMLLLQDKAEKLALFADVFHSNPPRISTTPSADN